MSSQQALARASEVLKVVEDARRDVRYIVTDFSVELIVSKFRDEAEAEGDIYIPDYQRKLAWTRDQQSYFIESLILRVPVPPVFFYDVKGLLEVVDGSQRIRTLVAYLRGRFCITGVEKLDVLNGLYFADLPTAIQKRFLNTPVRSFVLEEGTDESTRIDLFRRLNTSGKKLADAEIRKGAFKGPFLDLVIECASEEVFKKITPHIGGRIDPVAERQELVTRFFIYSEKYQEFTHDVRRFLDANTSLFNKSLSSLQVKNLKRYFLRTMDFISENYPLAFYRTDSSKRLPRVRFEAVAVGTGLAIRTQQNLISRPSRWLRSEEFERLVRAEATNSAPKLKARIEFVRDRLIR
jgi:hypothetical protein